MQEICTTVLSEMQLSLGDVLFHQGQHAVDMYFLVSGASTYVFKGVGQSVLKGSWFSEAVLWTPWVHRGEIFRVLLGMP